MCVFLYLLKLRMNYDYENGDGNMQLNDSALVIKKIKIKMQFF